jgi:hypothetical protein
MDPLREYQTLLNRRHFFGRASTGIGVAALASMMNGARGGEPSPARQFQGEAGALPQPHFPAKAKRVIYLYQSGAPSQLDLFDPKPKMAEMFDKDIPPSVVNGQRFTTMTSGQKRFPIAPSTFKFQQHGKSGAWVSELLPYTSKVVDDLCFVKSVHTEAINHDPAITYSLTGSQLPGRPSMGAWLAYGLGSANRDLPNFVVLHSSWSSKASTQALYSRLWGAGFLPSKHQGVSFQSSGDPVLYLSNPPGMDRDSRRKMLDGLAQLNQQLYEEIGDPETVARISQYEMAFRMQDSVPELTDFSKEPQHVLDLYGPEVKTPGTFAFNCLMARRLAERGVNFVQVFMRDWDHHNALPKNIKMVCNDVDQGSAALVADLKRLGLLEDTLVIWGGEFGRTIYCQGTLTQADYGRDHHPRCFTIWMAGGGVKPGISFGETDDFSYNITKDPVHIHDVNATILHCLGIDHEKLTFRFQGRDFRLTDVHGNIVKPILA